MKTKKDAFVWIMVLILIGLFVWQLPNLYSLTSTKQEKTTVKKEEVKEIIPESYNCELIDNTTEIKGYTIVNRAQFNLNENGSVKEAKINLEIKFKDKNLYNTEKTKTISNEGIISNISNDDINSIRKINLQIDYSKYQKEETDDIVLNIINNYPTNYKELKKYLSNHLYSCN